MHRNNILWLDDLKRSYPGVFSGSTVLELGSRDINGTIRGHFEGGTYVGVDNVDGPGVDVVGNAQETDFSKESFDAIVSFSMFEHDPLWKETITHNTPFLRSGGMAFLSFGAEGNIEHGDCDFWGPVPSAEMLELLPKAGLEVIDSFFEEERYGKNCAGAFNIVARKL